MSQTTDVGSLAPLGHAISGAGSSALALLLIYPLDTIKTRQQVQTRAGDSAGLDSAVRKIIREEGVGGLYAGVASNVVNQAVNGFVYFYAYSMVRRMAQRAAGGEGLSTAVELAVGALAGMVNQVITLPMGVVATRQQTAHAAERRRTWVQTVRGIVRDEGVGGLWAGLRPALVLCANPAITYGMFERIKRAVTKGRPGGGLSFAEAFWAGAAAKALATVVTYPYIMAKVRLQCQPSGKQGAHRSAGDVLRSTLRSEGVGGWYRGMQAQIVKAVITQALMLMLKESVTRQVARLFAVARASRKHGVGVA